MNKNSPIEEKLRLIGLSKNESLAYLSILKLGRAGVSTISREAGLNRTTGYDILHKLVSKKLVSISGKGGKQEYLAESPGIIAKLIKQELEKKNNEMQILHDSISELNILHNKSNRPQIRFYEGESGLKQVYNDTLKAKEEIRAYASIDDAHKALPSYFPEYYRKRAEENISIRAIFNDTEHSLKLSKKDAEQLRVSAFVSKEKYGFHPEINIYDNKIMIASWREKLGIIIESEEISDAMKKIFELAWLQAKNPQNNN